MLCAPKNTASFATGLQTDDSAVDHSQETHDTADAPVMCQYMTNCRAPRPRPWCASIFAFQCHCRGQTAKKIFGETSNTNGSISVNRKHPSVSGHVGRRCRFMIIISEMFNNFSKSTRNISFSRSLATWIPDASAWSSLPDKYSPF